jgi:hypothetical protein
VVSDRASRSRLFPGGRVIGEGLDDPPAEEMFLDDAVDGRLGDAAIIGAFGEDLQHGRERAGAEAGGFGRHHTVAGHPQLARSWQLRRCPQIASDARLVAGAARADQHAALLGGDERGLRREWALGRGDGLDVTLIQKR